MSYMPKYIKGKVNTDNISEQNIKNACYNKEEIEAVTKFFKKINGLILTFSLWDYDNYSEYHLSGWSDDVDEILMEAFWVLEDTFGTLEREEFVEQWKDNEYDPGGSTTLPLMCVEELEVIQEEKKE